MLVLGTTEQQVRVLTELDPDEIVVPAADPALEKSERAEGRHGAPRPGQHPAGGLGPERRHLEAGPRGRDRTGVMTGRKLGRTLFLAAAVLTTIFLLPGAANAAPGGPEGPNGPNGGAGSNVTIELDGLTNSPSTSVTVLIGLTLISLLPAILLSCTAFTKIFVVLGLTRNALGLQQTPPNQVLAGLALFLSLFVMGPVLSEINEIALQPYLNGDLTPSAAIDTGMRSRCATSCSTTPTTTSWCC